VVKFDQVSTSDVGGVAFTRSQNARTDGHTEATLYGHRHFMIAPYKIIITGILSYKNIACH